MRGFNEQKLSELPDQPAKLRRLGALIAQTARWCWINGCEEMLRVAMIHHDHMGSSYPLSSAVRRGMSISHSCGVGNKNAHEQFARGRATPNPSSVIFRTSNWAAGPGSNPRAEPPGARGRRPCSAPRARRPAPKWAGRLAGTGWASSGRSGPKPAPSGDYLAGSKPPRRGSVAGARWRGCRSGTRITLIGGIRSPGWAEAAHGPSPAQAPPAKGASFSA